MCLTHNSVLLSVFQKPINLQKQNWSDIYIHIILYMCWTYSPLTTNTSSSNFLSSTSSMWAANAWLYIWTLLSLVNLSVRIIWEQATLSHTVAVGCQCLLSQEWKFMPTSFPHAWVWSGLWYHWSWPSCPNSFVVIGSILIQYSRTTKIIWAAQA